MDDPIGKSRELLLRNLDDNQRLEFEHGQSFHVRVDDDLYELKTDITIRKKDGARFCAVAPGLPVYDQLLARKLILENNPEDFFRVANKFEGTTNRIDLNLRGSNETLWGYALAQVKHRAQQMGMDARLLEFTTHITPSMYGTNIRCRYANRWDFQVFMDSDHFANRNAGQALSHVLEECLYGINRLVDEETKTRGGERT